MKQDFDLLSSYAVTKFEKARKIRYGLIHMKQTMMLQGEFPSEY